MNGFLTPMWPSLLPPVSDTLWFTADCPRFEEGELAQLEEELEQEKQSLKEQGQEWANMERSNVEQVEDEQDIDETEDESYMGDAVSDDVDADGPHSPPW